MRKEIPVYKHGDQRIITKFLLLPATVQKDEKTLEVRWLEYATIKQTYTSSLFAYPEWINTCFIDEQEK